MNRLKTYSVEIWVTDCYLAEGIHASTPKSAERIALDRWEQGALSPVENMQDVSSTHVEEVAP